MSDSAVTARRVAPFVLVLALGHALAACSSQGPGGAASDAGPAHDAAAPEPRRDGRIRLDDQWQRVAPMVIHEARMDLVVSCRIVMDRAKEEGREVPPLCYAPEKRPASAVKTLRVEHQPGIASDAMRRLASVAEGTHFIVERSGSRFQLLDLAYAARRDGSPRGDEIRILAMDGDVKRAAAPEVAPLVEALVALYPGVRVETVDVTPPPAPSPVPGGAP